MPLSVALYDPKNALNGTPVYPAQATQAEYELMLFYFLANVVLFYC